MLAFSNGLAVPYNSSSANKRTSTMSDPDPATRLAVVRDRIRLAAENCQRETTEIALIAVSKTRGSEAIRQLFSAGVTRFGENYLQEAQDKQTRLQDLPIEWHFIGPMQSNKTRALARNFSWVHSLDRLKIARRLSTQRPSDLPPLNCLIQVNIDLEANKSGVQPHEVVEFAGQLSDLEGIALRGLMAIPKASQDYETQLDSYRRLASLHASLLGDHPECDTLSMGMSGDLEAAIVAGATMVRVGTDLFGARG